MSYEAPAVVDYGDVLDLTAATQFGGPVDSAFNGVIIPGTPQASAP